MESKVCGVVQGMVSATDKQVGMSALQYGDVSKPQLAGLQTLYYNYWKKYVATLLQERESQVQHEKSNKQITINSNLVIADYGTADCKNNVAIIRDVLQMCHDTATSLHLVLIDLPTNNWGKVREVCKKALGLKEVKVDAIPQAQAKATWSSRQQPMHSFSLVSQSFYENPSKIIPGTVDIGFSGFALHWLSTVPNGGVLPSTDWHSWCAQTDLRRTKWDQVKQDGSPVTDGQSRTFLAEMRLQAHKDGVAFLQERLSDLKPGGRLFLVVLAASEAYQQPGKHNPDAYQGTIYEDTIQLILSRTFNDVIQQINKKYFPDSRCFRPFMAKYDKTIQEWEECFKQVNANVIARDPYSHIFQFVCPGVVLRSTHCIQPPNEERLRQDCQENLELFEIKWEQAKRLFAKEVTKFVRGWGQGIVKESLQKAVAQHKKCSVQRNQRLPAVDFLLAKAFQLYEDFVYRDFDEHRQNKYAVHYIQAQKVARETAQMH